MCDVPVHVHEWFLIRPICLLVCKQTQAVMGSIRFTGGFDIQSCLLCTVSDLWTNVAASARHAVVCYVDEFCWVYFPLAYVCQNFVS
jgi:hypothetical protein